MKNNWRIIVGTLLIIGGLGNFSKDILTAIFGIIIGAILFAWHFISKRTSSTQKASTNKPSENKAVTQTAAEAPKILRSKLSLASRHENYFMVYRYPNVKLAIDPALDLETLPVGNQIEIHTEPENEYDDKAVYVELGEKKIGYIYKGRLQDMIWDFIKRDDHIVGLLKTVDVENRIVEVELGFLKDIEKIKQSRESITAKLIKTSKKDFFDKPRSENLEFVNNGDCVDLEYNEDSETYIVASEFGDELGELSKSISEKIQNSRSANTLAIIDAIEENEDGKIEAKVLLYI